MGCWSPRRPVDPSLQSFLGGLIHSPVLSDTTEKLPMNTRATTTSTKAVMLLISSYPSMKANETGIETSTEARA